MGNIYTQFDARLNNLTADEAEWLEGALGYTPLHDDEGNQTTTNPPWYDDEGGFVDLDWEFEDDRETLRLYSEECRSVDAVGKLVMAFLNAKRDHALSIFTMTWTTTGDGANTGGAMVVTKDRWVVLDLDDWAERTARRVECDLAYPHFIVRHATQTFFDGRPMYWNDGSGPGTESGWNDREHATWFPEGIQLQSIHNEPLVAEKVS